MISPSMKTTQRGIYRIENGTVHAFYQNKKGERFTILFDESDLPVWEGWKWYVSNGYLVRSRTEMDGPGAKQVHFHRVLIPDGEEVDHISGNRLDDRRSNLRAATHAENLRNQRARNTNTSGVRGVVWNRAKGKWQAQIKVNGKNLYLGLYDAIEEAAAARLTAEGFHFGAFAPSTSRETA